MTDAELIDFLTELDKALLDVIQALQFENMQLRAVEGEEAAVNECE